MILFRPIKQTDYPRLLHMIQKAEKGITTLPRDPKTLAYRLQLACESFSTRMNTEHEQYFWFILENTETQAAMGVAALATHIGQSNHFYSYKRSKYSRSCPSLKLRQEDELLELTNDYEGFTELCTLYLDPDYRHGGFAAILSRARLLFVAQYSHLFSPILMTEIRGVTHQQGQSPFWNAVGKHFFRMSFAKADRLTLTSDKQFIADLMPQHPLYVSLLPKSARTVLGQPHALSKAAMDILVAEGFQNRGYIDIFDAGPTLEARQQDLHTIQHSHCLPAKISSSSIGSQAMLCNTKGEFKATRALIHIEEDQVCLSSKIAKLLNIESGDLILFIMDRTYEKR